MNQLAKTMLRVALVSLGLLMAPLVASRVVNDWNWPAGAFVRVYLLFFVTGMLYAAIAKKMGDWAYKAGVGVALVAGFALGWSTMVQTADSGHPERLWYLSVLVVGFIGACLARLKAPGLAVTLFAMAAVLALISVVLPSGAPSDMAEGWPSGMLSSWRCSPPQVYCSGTRVWWVWSKSRPTTIGAGSTRVRFSLGYL
ncbi:MAG TPA: hypothetical protein VE621_10470 [Bryobacteraceae bacterium]|nr:hypothetical protein [Bryobacteraceae bacterium]